jgi:hypothetical protein
LHIENFDSLPLPNMSGWKYAFSLSKAEVKEATPPGTVLLIGESLTITLSTAAKHELASDSYEFALSEC